MGSHSRMGICCGRFGSHSPHWTQRSARCAAQPLPPVVEAVWGRSALRTSPVDRALQWLWDQPAEQPLRRGVENCLQESWDRASVFPRLPEDGRPEYGDGCGASLGGDEDHRRQDRVRLSRYAIMDMAQLREGTRRMEQRSDASWPVAEPNERPGGDIQTTCKQGREQEFGPSGGSSK